MNSYKESRDKDNGFLGGPFFKMAYDRLFKEAGVQYHMLNLKQTTV